MDAIPDPDVLRPGTNQGEFPGEEGQKKALRTTMEGNNTEKKAEHGERETTRVTAATGRGTAAATAGEKTADPGRETVVRKPGTKERRETEEVPAAVWRRRATPGDAAGNQEAAQQTLATFWEERGHSRCVGQNVPDSGGRG
ncbi:hypothetical protein NDU88_000560 [Pleurodeles waltl]|uniref:Uncharacterized protein n=1 Tax=Pleurodeles waltl TaxID=8319 RepID=A0AAV7UTF3_PLEWA|nr:hypothetical protein NDU88_000560 [Pleurodeles waltl]